jgi:hypothetical protein
MRPVVLHILSAAKLLGVTHSLSSDVSRCVRRSTPWPPLVAFRKAAGGIPSQPFCQVSSGHNASTGPLRQDPLLASFFAKSCFRKSLLNNDLKEFIEFWSFICVRWVYQPWRHDVCRGSSLGFSRSQVGLFLRLLQWIDLCCGTPKGQLSCAFVSRTDSSAICLKRSSGPPRLLRDLLVRGVSS